MNRQKRPYYCQKCGELIGYGDKEFGRRKLCDVCNPSYVDWSSISYGEAKGKRKYQANSRIRELARSLYQKSDKPKQCANCGYDKHYEVCHIKGISTHSDDTPISVINDLGNLIALCPNCHWELDNGLLDITNIISKKKFQKPLDKLENMWYNPKRKEATTQN